MKKMYNIAQIAFEKLKFKTSCNLNGGKHFDLKHENQIFLRHVVLTK